MAHFSATAFASSASWRARLWFQFATNWASTRLKKRRQARCASVDIEDLKSRFRKLGEFIRSELRRSSVLAESIRLTYSLSMRSVGQAHEITVQVANNPEDVSALAIQKLFAESYAERYGRN